jgi:Fe-S-cluster containining protein
MQTLNIGDGIYEVDLDLFRATFRCLINCGYNCCRTGCYAAERDLQKIRRSLHKIKKYMDSEMRDKAWYRLGYSALSKVSPFKYVILSRTRSNGQKTCIFQRTLDRKCAIHIYDYKTKPLQCRLTPFISFRSFYLKHKLTFEHWYHKCAGFGLGNQLIHELAREELQELLGRKSFNQLLKIN